MPEQFPERRENAADPEDAERLERGHGVQKPEDATVAQEEAEQSVWTEAADETAGKEAQVIAPDEPPETGGKGPVSVPDLSWIRESINEIERRIGSIEETIRQRLRQDETKEEMFKALYDELQKHRQGTFKQATKRLLMSLLLYHDHLQSARENAVGEVQSELQFVIDELLGVLYSEEVEPITVAAGDTFEAREHRALGRISTTNETEDKTIDRVVRTGFRWGEQVLRPAEVYVRRYEPKEGVPVERDQGHETAEVEAD